MKELTSTELENIFHETHGRSECYKAIGLYHYFLYLCPSGQEISIQIAKEVGFNLRLYFLMLIIFLRSLSYSMQAPTHG